MFYDFIQAVAFYFVLSIGVGPIGIHLSNSTLSGGMRNAVPAVAGVTLGDFIWALIIGTQLDIISQFIENNKNILSVVAGIVLLLVGLRGIKNRKIIKEPKSRTGSQNLMIESLIINLTSPGTPMILIWVFVSICKTTLTNIQGIVMAMGCTIGAFAWYVIFCGIILKTKSALSNKTVVKIRTFSNSIMMVIGAYAVASGLIS